MYSLRKIFNPSLFQGSLKYTSYFEGWYFKHVAANNDDTFAVIPGISLSVDSHAFIQFVDGVSGTSWYFRYDLEDFSTDRRRFFIRIGDSVFTSNCIGLKLKGNNIKINGKIEYTDMVTLRPTVLRPGIMGWYSYVPGMECNHGVLSLNHFLAGSLYINGRKKSFSGGKGYIEKDWGTSFPESWIWMQCNNFSDEYISVMISVAKIPWKNTFFIGFIAFMLVREKTEIFATYNHSKIEYLRKTSQNRTEILLSKRGKKLKAVITGKESASVHAPVDGQMINRIKESISSEVTIEYSDKGRIIFSGCGTRAGFEENEGIYKYF